jgi:hypothetical protein
MLPKVIAVAACLLVLPATVSAVDFDPYKHGLVKPDGYTYFKPDPGLDCKFLRDAAEGAKKVFQCSDGSQRFGDSDVWSRPALKAPEPEKAEIKDFHPEVSLPGYSFMTITTWIDNRYCRSSKHGRCRGREVQSFSHMFVPVDYAACMIMAEKISYQEFLQLDQSRDRINISYECN